jgi:hypothetical protein
LIILCFGVRSNVCIGKEDTESANYLVAGCNNFSQGKFNVDPVLQALCFGRVAGIADVSQSNGLTCAPEAVNIRQVLLVVVKYVNEHPQRMHERFSLLTLEALQIVWPCHAQ